MTELDKVVDREFYGHALHIVRTAHVGERPALAFQFFDELLHPFCIPLFRGVLESVGKHSNHCRSIVVVLDAIVQSRNRLAHGIVERRATPGAILLEILNLGNGLAVDERAHRFPLTVSVVEGDQRQEVLLRVGKLLLRTANAVDCLGHSTHCCMHQILHRPTFIHNNQVVDSCFFVFVLLFHCFFVKKVSKRFMKSLREVFEAFSCKFYTAKIVPIFETAKFLV